MKSAIEALGEQARGVQQLEAYLDQTRRNYEAVEEMCAKLRAERDEFLEAIVEAHRRLNDFDGVASAEAILDKIMERFRG